MLKFWLLAAMGLTVAQNIDSRIQSYIFDDFVQMNTIGNMTHGTQLKWDPEFLAWRSAANSTSPPLFKNVLDLRDYVNRRVHAVMSQYPTHNEVEQSQYKIASYDGVQIIVTRFATESHLAAASPQPALLYAFGGGMIAGSVEIFAPKIADYVHRSGVQFFAVSYRLAPENQAPTGVEDFYAAIKWLSESAPKLGVDPARLGVTGESAGGGLAAAGALLARDRGLKPPLAKQVLVYPMLDDRNIATIGHDSPLSPFLVWTWEENRMSWESYVGVDNAGKLYSQVSPYTAPGRHPDLAGLPSTYIDIGNLDLFRDETMGYMSRLSAANLDVEFHLIPGAPHTFDYAVNISISQRAFEARTRAFQSF